MMEVPSTQQQNDLQPPATTSLRDNPNRKTRNLNGPFFSDVEEGVLKELNHARCNPQSFALYVEGFRTYYSGKNIRVPGEIMIRTEEGVAALDEAVQFLRKQSPVPSLSISKGLSRAALDHVLDTGPTGKISHGGNDESQPADRMSRYGTWDITCGENISFGRGDAAEIVKQLIVDDGVPGRGHRTNIFNPKFRVVGISHGSHKQYDLMCVQDFAGGYLEVGQLPPAPAIALELPQQPARNPNAEPRSDNPQNQWELPFFSNEKVQEVAQTIGRGAKSLFEKVKGFASSSSSPSSSSSSSTVYYHAPQPNPMSTSQPPQYHASQPNVAATQPQQHGQRQYQPPPPQQCYPSQPPPIDREIGRASCRERV
eukprot:TRINITY_DN308_c0_g1_i3.p1 TRINITY_DN308_c0_g1~~TRINITY_DN308_c0_g1_i3.p1  ORF type:complete len:369 (-),score=34.98 TRINITY_DN308_c0_g1_i3:64-1170(-)